MSSTDLLTPSNIMFAIGIIGVIFSIYQKFSTPQSALDKKAEVLAQQLQWLQEGNEKKFTEMQLNIKEATTMAQNHIHSTDLKIEHLAKAVTAMNLHLSTEITKLSTIIHERFISK